MNFPSRKQKIGAFLMAIWLCSWIGITLFHGLSHATHADDFASPCLVCHLLDQPATTTLQTTLALKDTPFFECVRTISSETVPHVARHFPESVVPRGPPASLFI